MNKKKPDKDFKVFIEDQLNTLVVQQKEFDDIAPLSVKWQFLGNSSYDLTPIRYTKNEIVENVSVAINAAKRQVIKDMTKGNK